MDNIKYIYFELYSEPVVGEEKKIAKIQNENALMFKPHTNSSGIWGFANLTKSYRYKTKDSTTSVEQIWIDLEKYDSSHINRGKFDEYVKDCLNKLKNKLKNNGKRKI